MRTFDAQQTAAALDWAALVEALRAMLVRRHAGQTASPERLALPLPGGVLLAMPALDGEYASVKLATLHDANPARGMPTLIGEVILMKADTGERLAMLDAPTVTARRTAALSALAALELAPHRRRRLLIVGSGVQARAHLDAFLAIVGVSEVLVHSRHAAHADDFARAARERGIDCLSVDLPLASLIGEVDLVVTATPSRAALFDDTDRFGGFVAAIGAYLPQMCELPAALLRRSALYVDDLPGARVEAGDLIQAGIDWERVTPLERVVADAAPRPAAGPVVFKSVGHAAWDLAACRLAWTRASAMPS